MSFDEFDAIMTAMGFSYSAIPVFSEHIKLVHTSRSNCCEVAWSQSTRQLNQDP